MDEITAGSWIAWVVIGLAGGLLCHIMFGTKRLFVFDALIGIAGAIAGGWGASIFTGTGSRFGFFASALCAIFVAAVALWIFNYFLTLPSRRR